MALSDLFTEVGTALGRGNSLSARIPGWVRAAAEFLEQNYSFQYMKKEGRISVDAGAASPWQLDFPSTRVKEIELLRRVRTFAGGQEVYDKPIKPVSPGRVSALNIGAPSGYWLDGESYLNLDVIPAENMELQILYYEYTDWPSSDAATPRLLAKYFSLLKAQTVLVAAAELRDTRLDEIFSNPRSLVGAPALLNAALRAEEALKAQQHEIPYVQN